MAHVFLVGLEVQTEHSETFFQTVGVALLVNRGRDSCEAVKIKFQNYHFFLKDGDGGRASVPYKGARWRPIAAALLQRYRVLDMG